jgi:hypothetical protein
MGPAGNVQEEFISSSLDIFKQEVNKEVTQEK